MIYSLNRSLCFYTKTIITNKVIVGVRRWKYIRKCQASSACHTVDIIIKTASHKLSRGWQSVNLFLQRKAAKYKWLLKKNTWNLGLVDRLWLKKQSTSVENFSLGWKSLLYAASGPSPVFVSLKDFSGFQFFCPLRSKRFTNVLSFLISIENKVILFIENKQTKTIILPFFFVCVFVLSLHFPKWRQGETVSLKTKKESENKTKSSWPKH